MHIIFNIPPHVCITVLDRLIVTTVCRSIISCRGITPNKGKIYLFRFFTNLLVGWKRWRRLLETECFLPCDGALHCSVWTNKEKKKRIVLTWETNISIFLSIFQCSVFRTSEKLCHNRLVVCFFLLNCRAHFCFDKLERHLNDRPFT